MSSYLCSFLLRHPDQSVSKDSYVSVFYTDRFIAAEAPEVLTVSLSHKCDSGVQAAVFSVAYRRQWQLIFKAISCRNFFVQASRYIVLVKVVSNPFSSFNIQHLRRES